MNMIKQLKTASIAIIILGIIHICATPVVFAFFKTIKYANLSSVYMFIMVGIYTIFLGWLQYFALQKLNNDKAFHSILKATILLLGIGGTSAVATMLNNPFAYIILLIAFYEAIIFFPKPISS